MAKHYYESPERIVTVKKGEQEWSVPLERWEAALDKVTTLSWVSAEYKAPTSFDWYNETIYFSPDRFEYPITNDAEELLAHLHYYGVFTEFNPAIEPKKCSVVRIDNRKLREVEQRARSMCRKTFQQFFLESGCNIAPVPVKYTGLAGGMKYDADKRRLTFTLVTSDKDHLWQDFMVEWNDEDFGEMYMMIIDYNEKIPVWVDYSAGPNVMPEPTTGTTDSIEELLPQAEFIEQHLLTRWGGARPNAGRKKETDQVSARVPLDVLDALKDAAKADGVSLSAKTAEVLAEWAKKKTNNE